MNVCQKFSIRAALAFAYTNFINNIALLLQLIAISVGMYATFALVIKLVSHVVVNDTTFLLLRLLLPAVYIIAGIISVIIKVGETKICLGIKDGTPVTIRMLLSSKELILKAVSAELLYVQLVALGLIAFIIPGIIVAVMYNFYLFVLIDTNCNVWEAFKKSALITKSCRWKIFAYLVIDVVLMILSFGLLAPVTALGKTYIYRQLHSRQRTTTFV